MTSPPRRRLHLDVTVDADDDSSMRAALDEIAFVVEGQDVAIAQASTGPGYSYSVAGTVEAGVTGDSYDRAVAAYVAHCKATRGATLDDFDTSDEEQA